MGRAANPGLERLAGLRRASLLLGSDGRQGCLAELPDALVLSLLAHNAMALKNAACIGIDDEYWMVSGIQEDRVCGLRSNAIQAQQFFAKFFRTLRKHLLQGAFVAVVQECDERLQALSFLAKIPGWPNEALETGQRHASNALCAQQLRTAKIRQGAFYVCPRGVLRQVGSDDHFKLRLCGPPMLRTPRLVQSGVVVADRPCLIGWIIGSHAKCQFIRARTDEAERAARVESNLLKCMYSGERGWRRKPKYR